MELVWTSLFWLSLAVLAYTYIGYPVLLGLLARLAPPAPGLGDPATWPVVTVLVPVHNEERAIVGKLDNLLELDYPADRLQILVVSDASTDRTDAIVEANGGRGIDLIRVGQRNGKIAAQNSAIPYIKGEYVVCTDGSVLVDRGAVKALVRRFLADESIGVVSGTAVGRVSGRRGETQGDVWYLGYEMMLRLWESMIGSTVGSAGALYAQRRELFEHYPEHLSRDFGSALVARERNLRAVLEPRAICHVYGSESLAAEYRRKVRTATRGIQTMRHHAALANPFRYGLYSVKLLSHKLARWLSPVLVLAALVSSLFLMDSPFYAAIGTLLAIGSGLAVAVGLAAIRRPIPAYLSWPGYLGIANLAVLEAWRNTLAGRKSSKWEPTRRRAVEIGGLLAE